MDRRLFSVIRSCHAFSAGRSAASFGQVAGSNLIASRNGSGYSLCLFEKRTFVAQSLLHVCRTGRRADRAAKMAPHRLLMAGLVVNGCGILIAGFSTNLWLLMPVQFIIALLQPAIFVGNHALVIKHTEQE
jgi:Ca2+/Na+ antiporter